MAQEIKQDRLAQEINSLFLLSEFVVRKVDNFLCVSNLKLKLLARNISHLITSASQMKGLYRYLVVTSGLINLRLKLGF